MAGRQGQTLLYNGYQTEENLPLQAGDQNRDSRPGVSCLTGTVGNLCWQFAIRRRCMSAFGREQWPLPDWAVLGSHIAGGNAGAGKESGKLLLVDFDTVEISNLNRQHYAVRHLGMPKTEALPAMQLQEINPFVQITTRQVTVCAENAV